MMKVKSLVLISVAILSSVVNAGEFSKIDYVVRLELSRYFGTDYDSVWNLSLGESSEDCLVTVKAKVSKFSQWGEFSYETLSCVNRVEDSGISTYQSVVVDYQTLSN